jgi:ParB/RepB/Spo0J family partition protein
VRAFLALQLGSPTVRSAPGLDPLHRVPMSGGGGATVGSLNVPLDQIVAEGNIREFAGNDEQARSLLNSVRAVGVLEPVLLTTLPKGPRSNGYRYKLIAGFRRYTAACQAGLDDIPARVLKGLSAAQVLEIRLTENLQRLDMNPIEEAKALRDYIAASGCTQDVAGRKLGRTGGWVSARLGLLRLPEEVQAMLSLGKLRVDFAVALEPYHDRPRDVLVQLARRAVIAPNIGSFRAHLSARMGERNKPAGARDPDRRRCECSCSCCLAKSHVRVT